MTLWYLAGAHYGIDNDGNRIGPDFNWAHGKECSEIPLDDVTPEWIIKNGFKTAAAARRALNPLIDRSTDKWWSVLVTIRKYDVPDHRLRYKIHRCYEIVIEDEDGNQVGDCNYCYGTKADAEEMAKHELKIANMDREVR